jgi:hypothetical protein
MLQVKKGVVMKIKEVRMATKADMKPLLSGCGAAAPGDGLDKPPC